ncbi:hypothetical protein [Streptomyces sp. RKAG293]|uniref:hypothetical protein n=1 Tax=Streptomyces sp. RKAG293 TaxID=2893403 RepID=UPI0020346E79|nr:hypothetical protein [Streptomyces sp. RKAG293]MCM2422617.1 hypothetical protein [Streptomyces sp. RKAG293]
MSGSPKYSTVVVDASIRLAEAARRAEQEALRRRREQERAAQRARAAAARAAERSRRDAERAAARQLQDQSRRGQALRERTRVGAAELAEVTDLITGLRGVVDPGVVSELESEAAGLAEHLRVGGVRTVDGATASLRTRVLRHQEAMRARLAPQEGPELIAGLEARLAAARARAAVLDPGGHADCGRLLAELRAAFEQGATVRFQALRGTVEHALRRHADAVARAEAAERAEAERAEDRRERGLAQEALRAEAAEQAEQHRAEALAEAAERAELSRPAVIAAIADATEAGDRSLAVELTQAIRAVDTAAAAGDLGQALDAVAGLEQLLPRAEARLDELQLEHDRRIRLARALQVAMANAGLEHMGQPDLGNELVLRFQRKGGAVYTTTIGSRPDGSPLLTYRIEGETDVPVTQSAAESSCDSTEKLLDRVHAAVADSGFRPGEVVWRGKPLGRGPQRPVTTEVRTRRSQ